MTAAEQMSADVWNRLKQSQQLSVRLGEETLTDILTLDFTRLAGRRAVKMFQTPKNKESQTGTDLEVFVSVAGGRAYRYAIQAKKLYPNKRYDNLNARVGKHDLFQIDILEDYANQEGVVPFYLLFNYVHRLEATRHWHCCQTPVDEKQLGCTLVPSCRVRKAIGQRGCRNFAFLHTDPAALPFRCRFDCPRDARWDRKSQTKAIGDESCYHADAPQEAHAHQDKDGTTPTPMARLAMASRWTGHSLGRNEGSVSGDDIRNS